MLLNMFASGKPVNVVFRRCLTNKVNFRIPKYFFHDHLLTPEEQSAKDIETVAVVRCNVFNLHLPQRVLDYLFEHEKVHLLANGDFVVKSNLPHTYHDNRKVCMERIEHAINVAFARTASKRPLMPPEKYRFRFEKTRLRQLKENRREERQEQGIRTKHRFGGEEEVMEDDHNNDEYAK